MAAWLSWLMHDSWEDEAPAPEPVSGALAGQRKKLGTPWHVPLPDVALSSGGIKRTQTREP